VTAAVLVHRALTWALPILAGIGCYLWWRRTPLQPQPTTHPRPPAGADPAAAAAADRPGMPAGNRQPQARAHVRHPNDVLRVVLGALLLLATMTAIHQHRIGVREANMFRLINDLGLASIMVDQQGQIWLVDFDRAEAAASQAPLDHDAATLLAALDGMADTALVRATAERALGQDTLAGVLSPAAATPAASIHAAQGS
jgi:hypothetical protein